MSDLKQNLKWLAWLPKHYASKLVKGNLKTFKKRVPSSDKEYVDSQAWMGEPLTHKIEASIDYFLSRGAKPALLDIGCNKGQSLAHLKKLGFLAYGIDLHYENKSLNLVKGEADKLPWKDKTFNSIFMRHSLEHLRNLDVCMAEIRRVCKPGALIFVLCPSEIVPRGKHYNAFPNADVMREFLEKEGFKTLEYGLTKDLPFGEGHEEIYYCGKLERGGIKKC